MNQDLGTDRLSTETARAAGTQGPVIPGDVALEIGKGLKLIAGSLGDMSERLNAADDPETLTSAINHVASGLRALGTAGAGPHGAVEYLAMQIKEGAEIIAGAVRDHAEAVKQLALSVHIKTGTSND